MGNFEALVGCVPELVSFGSQFISNEDHFLALGLKFMSGFSPDQSSFGVLWSACFIGLMLYA